MSFVQNLISQFENLSNDKSIGVLSPPKMMERLQNSPDPTEGLELITGYGCLGLGNFSDRILYHACLNPDGLIAFIPMNLQRIRSN